MNKLIQTMLLMCGLLPALGHAVEEDVASEVQTTHESSWRVVGRFEQGGVPVTIHMVRDVVADGVTQEQFAMQVGRELRQQTAENGYEFCALLCQPTTENRSSVEPASWGARIITIRAHAVCPRTTACPAGMRPTDIDVHSHVHATRYTPNEIDALFLTRRYREGQQVFTDPERPSEADRHLGEGYLATPTRLVYLNERGRAREVAEF